MTGIIKAQFKYCLSRGREFFLIHYDALSSACHVGWKLNYTFISRVTISNSTFIINLRLGSKMSKPIRVCVIFRKSIHIHRIMKTRYLIRML